MCETTGVSLLSFGGLELVDKCQMSNEVVDKPHPNIMRTRRINKIPSQRLQVQGHQAIMLSVTDVML